jgi:hypothetical protein
MRLQCNLCGSKSIDVSSPIFLLMTPAEQQAISEFAALHNLTCANNDPINFPTGACSPETLTYEAVGPFGSKKPPPVSARKPHGHFEYTGPYGEVQEGDTLSCCHCRRHWQVRKGSGEDRGYCWSCGAVTCGHADCEACVPHAQRQWNIEHGLPELTPKPIMAAVPSLPSGLLLSTTMTMEVSDGISSDVSGENL